MAVYPSHHWEIWNFAQVPQGFWKEKEHQVQFFEAVQKQLKVSTLEDWYKVRASQVHALGGKGLLTSYYNDSLFAGKPLLLNVSTEMLSSLVVHLSTL